MTFIDQMNLFSDRRLYLWLIQQKDSRQEGESPEGQREVQRQEKSRQEQRNVQKKAARA